MSDAQVTNGYPPTYVHTCVIYEPHLLGVDMELVMSVEIQTDASHDLDSDALQSRNESVAHEHAKMGSPHEPVMASGQIMICMAPNLPYSPAISATHCGSI